MKNIDRRYLAVALSGVFVLAIVTFIGYRHFSGSKSTPEYSGPTAQDKRDAEENKIAVERRKQIEEEAKNNPRDATDPKKQVSPQIVNASQTGDEVFVSATISGLFEDSGTCTLTAVLGDKEIKRTSSGFADATTTSCTPFRLNRSDFPLTGNWSIVISYSSSTAEGASQAGQLVIQ